MKDNFDPIIPPINSLAQSISQQLQAVRLGLEKDGEVLLKTKRQLILM
jgi:hypothetical protein